MINDSFFLSILIENFDLDVDCLEDELYIL